jgi:hypothetical protein
MNELQRLAYLEAMDITSFVSRRDLPGAAPSRRLVAISRAQTPASNTGRESIPDLSALVPESRPSRATPAATAPVSTRAAGATESPVFSVVATAAGGWLWIDEIPAGREPGDDYGQLVIAICRALGLPGSAASVDRFNYPVAARLAGGVDEARQALFGFLSGRLSRTEAHGLILLGEFAERWFDRTCLEGRRVVQTVSAWRMLREPQLKARAWEDLKCLRGDGS